ncbi:hypothetical protein [Corallococcus exiguus]|uniref:DUF7919 family protein n=1 Tax=Corallococcus exiguus TaxID=83462 RepID=UPI00156126AC|nr:hypothetical protein [Corallococcus exiguus]NRD44297.1 hypothetical protein [Corallococcus exiguus]
MFRQDLDPISYLEGTGAAQVAVGWLERGQPFSRGLVDEAFFMALARLCAAPWQPFVTAGRQPCTFCRFSGGPALVARKGVHVPIGASNVFVPGAERLYVAPTMVVHYIDAHEYLPPAEFQDAVLRCPEMRSMAYLKAIRALGFSLRR